MAAETGNAVGLFDGWSGAALACHELAACFVEQSAEWNRLANVCLEHELSGLDVKPDGSLSVDYSGIDFGYLSEGLRVLGFHLPYAMRMDMQMSLKLFLLRSKNTLP